MRPAIERAAAAEPVAEAAGGQQQAGEHDRCSWRRSTAAAAALAPRSPTSWGSATLMMVWSIDGDQQGEDEHAEDLPPLRMAVVRLVRRCLGGGASVHDWLLRGGWPGSTVAVRGSGRIGRNTSDPRC